MLADETSRAWVEIRSSALQRNFLAVRERVGTGCRIFAVVKADAYGLGVDRVVGALRPLDPFGFAVATCAEAQNLRDVGVVRPVLVLSPLDGGSIEAALRARASVTVSDIDVLRRLKEGAGDRHVRFHVEIDTGMGRAGFDPFRVDEWAPRLRALESDTFVMEGCWTHFHSAEDTDLRVTQDQWHRFEQVISRIESGRTGAPLIRHAANSAAAFRMQGDWGAVRPGIFLYGGGAGSGAPAPEPVVSVRARVLLVRAVRAGSTVGYGATHRAEGARHWATLGIGYGDGLPRALGNLGQALVAGRVVPIIGRISMDLTVVDISDATDVAVGDVATLVGSDGGSELTLDAVAEQAGTISYEVLTGLTPRLPRVWV